ncbi:apoptosis regulator BAX-like [Betta splendens]|uniref:Apoptosis regulator BAX-like n=1 Tax=Betta splendens TaxID=158456 RepID=A0A6P7NCS2_BETSP|nr:apoptosis regulator BAX-like [Betta splendens]
MACESPEDRHRRMSCEGDALSDERIGEALIQEVIEEELKEVRSEDVPPFTPVAVNRQSDQEQKMVNQLATMVRIIGDKMHSDRAFQDAIDGMVQISDSKWDRFRQVADKVFEHGITWERIAVLIYVAGRLAVKMVRAHLPQSVRDVLRWTVDYFKNHLLNWVQSNGGWISSFSVLAAVSMQRVSSISSYGLVLVFVAGVGLGSIVTWRMTR